MNLLDLIADILQVLNFIDGKAQNKDLEEINRKLDKIMEELKINENDK